MIINNMALESAKRFWKTPPKLYNLLDQEFNFDFDPCPCPRPIGYNSLDKEWKKMNYVNPLFLLKDCDNKQSGPTAFVRKAIEQSKKGKSSFLTIPTQSYVNLLLDAGAIPRSLGRVKWLEVDTNEPMKGPSNITGFYLKGNSVIDKRDIK